MSFVNNSLMGHAYFLVKDGQSLIVFCLIVPMSSFPVILFYNNVFQFTFILIVPIVLMTGVNHIL